MGVRIVSVVPETTWAVKLYGAYTGYVKEKAEVEPLHEYVCVNWFPVTTAKAVPLTISKRTARIILFIFYLTFSANEDNPCIVR
jgi:hypothetical protein